MLPSFVLSAPKTQEKITSFFDRKGQTAFEMTVRTITEDVAKYKTRIQQVQLHIKIQRGAFRSKGVELEWAGSDLTHYNLVVLRQTDSMTPYTKVFDFVLSYPVTVNWENAVLKFKYQPVRMDINDVMGVIYRFKTGKFEAFRP
ncbi:MAG: hypothetical protein HYU64_20095 [Armatimonadetes bacterium]|nr:hypothetical protein [Armatimonadota bacterium]